MSIVCEKTSPPQKKNVFLIVNELQSILLLRNDNFRRKNEKVYHIPDPACRQFEM